MEDRNEAEGGSEEPAKKASGIWARFTQIIMPIAGLFLMLGEASDAAFLLNDMSRSVIEVFSNRVEYDMLEKIHVGNTVTYAESILGDPQISRAMGDDVTANYFHSSKYLVTLFSRDDRVEAFGVLALQDGFSPSVELGGLGHAELGEFAFSDTPTRAVEMAVDHSRTTDYYLESLESGPAGRFVNLYLGSVGYGTGGASPAIGELYSAVLDGETRAVSEARTNLRASGKPNFYGEGLLSLKLIEASMLTNAEFNNFFENP